MSDISVIWHPVKEEKKERKNEKKASFFSEHPTAMWIVDIQEYILAMPHFTFYSIYLLLTLEGPPPLQSIRPSHFLPSGSLSTLLKAPTIRTARI